MDKVIMPKSLTAENGAKHELIGEFSVKYKEPCLECETSGCESCDGYGYYMNVADIPWTTIKEIYQKAVELFGEELTNETR